MKPFTFYDIYYTPLKELDDKHAGYFEARIRRKGMYIEASGRDFETMRKRFMDRLAAFYAQPTVTAESAISSTPTAKTILFGDYGREWLKVKEQTTKPSTFKEYERSFRVDLEPTFGNKPLADITRNDLQNYLFGIVGENKHRKAEKLALISSTTASRTGKSKVRTLCWYFSISA